MLCHQGLRCANTARAALTTPALCSECLRYVQTTFEKLQPEEQAVLQKQSQNVYRMCMRIHRASVDVDTWRMIEASVDKSRVHLDGDAATWASLVSRCPFDFKCLLSACATTRDGCRTFLLSCCTHQLGVRGGSSQPKDR